MKEGMQHFLFPVRLWFHILALLLVLHIPQASTSPDQIPQPPIPSYPNVSGFARGSIDLGGGLRVFEARSFNKIWAINQGGYENSGTSFFEPVMIPDGYYLLGHYSQPRRKPIYASLLVAQDTSSDPNYPILAKPTGYTLVWTSVGVTINKDGEGYIWRPIPPSGYKPVGYIVTRSQDPPSVDIVRVVHHDFTALVEKDQWIWGYDDFNMHTTRPSTRGISSHSVPVGTFWAVNSSAQEAVFACLRRPRSGNSSLPDLSSMPNVDQVRTMVEAYSPVVYFHADEEYFPSSIEWFFDNGASLYYNGQPKPEPVNTTDWNLPIQGSIDDYYLDLPSDDAAQGRVKEGDTQSAKAYIHVKPAFGATYTDLSVWLFYPFNGPVKIQFGPFTIKSKLLGEHVGDWEHFTLRVDNFNGGLKSVYVTEKGKGSWINAMEMEFAQGNKPVMYSSLHSHKFYSHPSQVIHWKNVAVPQPFRVLRWGLGVRNDTGKGGNVMDIGKQYEILQADMNSSLAQPPWLLYPGRWGPKIDYDVDMLIDAATSKLPWIVKKVVRKLLKALPKEIFGEEGPQGPMMKDSWAGDES